MPVSNEGRLLRWLEMVVALLVIAEDELIKTDDERWWLAGVAIGPALRELLDDPRIYQRNDWYDEA